MRAYLIRHAQTRWNLEGRAQGHSDIELDATGETQSHLLVQHLLQLEIDQVWSSDMRRASKTAEALAKAKDVPHWSTKLLRERAFGDWEGEPFSVIRERFETIARDESCDNFEIVPPNGESMIQVFDRLHDVNERLSRETGDICIITHGGTQGLLLARVLRAAPHIAKAFRFNNSSVTTLERRADGLYSLIGYNETPHLAESGVEMIDASAPVRR